MLNTLILPDLSQTGALGSLVLLLAMGMAILGLVLSVLGGLRRDPRLIEGGRRSAWGVFAFSSLAVILLERALITNDFSLRYVAQSGFTEAPLWVKMVTLWGALEGSILFWAWVLALYTFILSLTARKDALRPWAMGTMFVSLIFFLGVNLGISNPFTAVPNPPLEGGGLNALLQNHWMMRVHPVLLYLGFVGLSVPFAYAVASMVTGQLGSSWIVQTRRWTLTAWSFLAAAIVAGGYWSYETLGWGGYWAWDPVEITSFIPWLLATAFLHSVQIQERKRSFAAWNLWLIVLAYASTVFGTFLNRSGIVQSVHAFGNGPIGIVFLGFFALLLLIGVGLATWRSSLIRDQKASEGILSREGGYLAGNVIFISFAVLSLLGVLYPVLIESLKNIKTQVGPQFYNQFAAPLGWFLLAFMGLGPMLTWRRMTGEALWKQARAPLVLAIIPTVTALIFGIDRWTVLLTIFLCAFNVIGLLFLTVKAALERNRKNPLRAALELFVALPRRYGAYLAHFGLVVLVLGITFSTAYKQEEMVRVALNESKTVFGNNISFLLTSAEDFSHKRTLSAKVIYDGEEYEPSVSIFKNSSNNTFSPAVHYHFWGDSYIVLTESDQAKGEWVVLRVIESPLVSWIWLGTLIMVIGSGISVMTPSPNSLERKRKTTTALEGTPA